MFISPAVAGDRAYIGSCSGTFFAFGTADGEVLWTYDTAEDGVSAQFHGDPLVTDDLIVVGSDARPMAYLYAFARADGEVRWASPFPGGVVSDLQRHGSTVLAVAVSGEVVAVDLASGETRWRVDEAPEEARGARSGDPALAGGYFFVPWRPGVVDAFDATTGERRWRRSIGAILNTSAAVVGDQVWVGTLDGYLHRLRRGDGEPFPALELDGPLYGNLVVAGDCVLALWATGGVDQGMNFAGPHVAACLEPATGEARWRHESAGEWGTFQPLVRGGEVILGTEGELLALDLTDGTVRWRNPVHGLPRGLGSSDELLFVGTLQGPVLAIPWGTLAPAASDRP